MFWISIISMIVSICLLLFTYEMICLEEMKKDTIRDLMKYTTLSVASSVIIIGIYLLT